MTVIIYFDVQLAQIWPERLPPDWLLDPLAIRSCPCHSQALHTVCGSAGALSAPLLESAISPRSSASCWWGTASRNQELGTKDTRLLLSVVLSVDRAGSWILKPRVHHGARHIATPRGSVPTISPPFLLLPTVPSHWGLRNVSNAVLIKVPCNPASQQWFQKLRLFTGCQFSLPPWGWIQPVVSSI